MSGASPRVVNSSAAATILATELGGHAIARGAGLVPLSEVCERPKEPTLEYLEMIGILSR